MSHGPTEKKLTIVQDNDENQLFITLKSYVTLPKSENDDCKNRKVKHVAAYVVVDEEDDNIENKDATCCQCEPYRQELFELLAVINEIRNNEIDSPKERKRTRR